MAMQPVKKPVRRRSHEAVLYIVTKEPTVAHPNYVKAKSSSYVFRTRARARKFQARMNQQLARTAARAKKYTRPHYRYSTPVGATWGPGD